MRMPLTRAEAIFDDGSFFDLLSHWVSHPTECQNEACKDTLRTYLTGAITPYLENMGFGCRLAENPVNLRLYSVLYVVKWRPEVAE